MTYNADREWAARGFPRKTAQAAVNRSYNPTSEDLDEYFAQHAEESLEIAREWAKICDAGVPDYEEQLELPLEWGEGEAKAESVYRNDYAAAFIVLLGHDGSISYTTDIERPFTFDRGAYDNEIRHAAQDLVEYFRNVRVAKHVFLETQSQNEAMVAEAIRKMLLKGSLHGIGR